ncbi:MAG: DUF3368 domain-containing protein [Archaeoglobaceae archaeon]
MIAVSNTSPLIALSNIKELGLFNFLFEKVIIPVAVSEEFAEKLPEWLEVKEVQNEFSVDLLREKLQKGESEAIALAHELKSDLVIIDDKQARRLASYLGLNVVGTVGLIFLAKKKGYYKEIGWVIEKLVEKGFRLDKQLVDRVLKEAGEL